MTQSLPMFGTFDVQVLRCMPVSIHGDVYFDLMIRVLAGDSPTQHNVRAPLHLCGRPPRPGDRLRMTFLMQQVNDIAWLT